MNPEQLAVLKQYLDRSSASLSEPVARRLAEARQRAVQRAQTQTHIDATRHGTLQLSLSSALHDYRFWLGMAALLLALMVGHGYFKPHAELDASDVDLAILTSEQPIEDYLD